MRKAIIIVAAVAGYFIIRPSIITPGVSANLEPVYNAFLTCLEEDTLEGITTLEAQGGYIELPEFEPGNAHSFLPSRAQNSSGSATSPGCQDSALRQ